MFARGLELLDGLGLVHVETLIPYDRSPGTVTVGKVIFFDSKAEAAQRKSADSAPRIESLDHGLE